MKYSRRQQALIGQLTDHLEQEFRDCHHGAHIPYGIGYGMIGDGDSPDSQKVINGALDNIRPEFPNVRQTQARDVGLYDYDFINAPLEGRTRRVMARPMYVPGCAVVACRLFCFASAGIALGAWMGKGLGVW